MTEITDAEAAEVLWASSEQGKAAVMAACRKADELGLSRQSGRPAVVIEPADIGAIVYAAYQAAGWDGEPDEGGKVYLATAGEYSDYRVVHAFSKREDAEAYELGDAVEEFEVSDGPVEVRRWYELQWNPGWPDRKADGFMAANPAEFSEYRDFDGDGRHVTHEWHEHAGRRWVRVQGWDLARVRKVYSEQRAQFLAMQADPDEPADECDGGDRDGSPHDRS